MQEAIVAFLEFLADLLIAQNKNGIQLENGQKP